MAVEDGGSIFYDWAICLKSKVFQELDREIVLNSIRFRWNNIREEFQKRYNSDKILESWQ